MRTSLLALSPARRAVVAVDLRDGALTDVLAGLTILPDAIAVDAHQQFIYLAYGSVSASPADDAPPGGSSAEASDGRIEKATLDGAIRTWIAPPHSLVTGTRLAGAWDRGRLYWVDRNGTAVRSVAVNGAGLRDEIVSGIGEDAGNRTGNRCMDIAVDEGGKYLYWAETCPSDGVVGGRIMRTPLDIAPGQTPSSRRTDVLWSGRSEPISLELDHDSHQLYWTCRADSPNNDSLHRGTIPSSGQCGGPIDTVSTGLGDTAAMTVNPSTHTAYVSGRSGRIRAVRLDGADTTVVAHIAGGVIDIAGF